MHTHYSENGRTTVCGFSTAALEGDWSDKKEDATCDRCKFYISEKARLDLQMEHEDKSKNAPNGAQATRE